MQIMV